MAASTLHVAAAAARLKTRTKKTTGRLLLFAYVAAEALDDARELVLRGIVSAPSLYL